jgi:hypothetical protein
MLMSVKTEAFDKVGMLDIYHLWGKSFGNLDGNQLYYCVRNNKWISCSMSSLICFNLVMYEADLLSLAHEFISLAFGCSNQIFQ